MAKTTINGTIRKPDDTAEEGYIYFALAETAALDSIEYSRVPIRVNLDASGQFTIQLQPTDDAGWSVSGLSYLVEERFSGKAPRRFYMAVPTSGSALDYADLATYANAPSIDAGVDLAAEWVAWQAAANATYERQDRRALNLLDLIGGSVSGSNDTAAVNAALAAFDAAGGGTLRIPKANWLFTGSTGLALAGTTNPIHIVADEGATFDMTGCSATVGLLLGGSLGSSAALGADVAAQAVTITCSLAVSPGDIVRIQSTDYWVNSLVKGELCEVLSTTGSAITFKSPLWDGYTAATTTVTKVNAPRVSVEGLTILRNSNLDGLEIKYARNLRLNKVHVEGARYVLIRTTECFGVVVEKCSGRDFWYSGTGTSYGLSVASCQHVTEIGNDFRGGRHAVMHGGTFPTRDVRVYGGTFDNYHPSGVNCFDFHENCDDVRMFGVTMLHGLNSQASNFYAEGCTAWSPATSAVAPVRFSQYRACDYVRWLDGDVRSGSSAGIGIQYTAVAGTVGRVEFTGRALAGSAARCVDVGSTGTSAAGIDRLILNGYFQSWNHVLRTYVTGGATEMVIREIHLAGRLVSTARGTLSILNPTTSRLYVTGEMVTQGSGFEFMVGPATGSMDTIIRNSRLAAEGVSGGASTFRPGRLVIQNSIIDGFATSAGVAASTASEAFISNVQLIGTTGSMSLPARHYSRINAAGKVTTQGAAAPAAGTWAVGDTCENTAPAAGGTPGWVCTTAGTPGTWKAMANVAA